MEPTLKQLAESLCEEIEKVAADRERKGGQHVPCHSRLANVAPSAMQELKWWAREMRAAMKREEGG